MTIIDDELLATFRLGGTCDNCLRRCKQRVPHHLKARGMGGGKRLDIRLNLLSLGPDFVCCCHRSHHDVNEPSYRELLGIVARREGQEPNDVECVLNILIRLPAAPTFERLEFEIFDIPKTARKLAIRTFKELGLDWRATR